MASGPGKGCLGCCRRQHGAAKVAAFDSVVAETSQAEPDEDSKPQASKPQGHEKDWFVTSSNRVKMVHDTSNRVTRIGAWDGDTKSEMQPTLSDMTCAESQHETLELCTCVQASKAFFDVRIKVNARGEFGFEVDESALVVTMVSKERLPIATGDAVKAVDGRSVATVAEYRQAVQGLANFTVTFCSKDLDGLPDDPAAQKDSASAIEFDRVEVAAMEDVGSITVPLRRIGDQSRELQWDWYIENSNVVDGLFKEMARTSASGTVVFEEGESTSYITVAVPKDPTWNVESLYFVHLKSQPKAANGASARLGDNTTLSVYSVNRVSFPAGAYGVMSDVDETVLPSMPRLIRCFLEHNYTEIPCETRWAVVYSVFPPLLCYIMQLSQKVLFDCGLATDEQAQCMLWGSVDITPATKTVNVLAMVGILRLIISILQHVIAVRKRMLKLGGKAKMKLRSNLFSTMLQLSERARDRFDDGDILKVLETDVQHTVQSIWLASFSLFEKLLDLTVQTILTVQIALTLPRNGMIIMLACIPFMASILFFMFLWRGRTQFDLQHMASVADENWSAFVTMCSACNPAILIYKRGWHFTKSFTACHANYNRQNYDAAVYSDYTLWILKHVFTVCSVVVIFRAGQLVQDGDLSVGGFLILFTAVEGFGSDLHAIAGIVNEMVLGTAAVRKIASVLNSETRRMERCLLQQRVTGQNHSHFRPSNDLSIQLKHVSFSYSGQDSKSVLAVPSLNLSILPGQAVCFPTESCEFGINTLFKVISGYLLPSEGHVRLPDRWRTVYVPVTPILFDGTLLYNLQFSDRARSRSTSTVWDVCRALGMSASLVGNADYDVGSHGCYLKFSDRVIVSIARALLHDVDLLLISSALDVLGESCAIKVLRYLRKYVQQRGLADELLPHALRHVKTVLFTSKFALLQRHAEQVVSLQVASKTAGGRRSKKQGSGMLEKPATSEGDAAAATSSSPPEKQACSGSEKQSVSGAEKPSAGDAAAAAATSSCPPEQQPGSGSEKPCSGGVEKQSAGDTAAAAATSSSPPAKQPGSGSEKPCSGGSEKPSARDGAAAAAAPSAPPDLT